MKENIVVIAAASEASISIPKRRFVSITKIVVSAPATSAEVAFGVGARFKLAMMLTDWK